MPDDINNLDSKDEGLKAIFGDRFHDETETAHAVKITRKAENPAKNVKAPAIKPKDSRDANWQPEKPEPNWYDRLKACAKVSLLFGSLCILFFYWQQTGQMQPSAALPCMLSCSALLGLGIGKHTVKGAM